MSRHLKIRLLIYFFKLISQVAVNNLIRENLNKKLKIESNLKWKKKAYTKKEFETAREIKLNESKKNVLKKIKAFSYKNYESVYLNFKGLKFELKKK